MVWMLKYGILILLTIVPQAGHSIKRRTAYAVFAERKGKMEGFFVFIGFVTKKIKKCLHFEKH